MIPTEGLIGTYAGQMVITLVLLGLGFIACTALTIAVMVRKAPPLTTQVDLMTGKKDHGVGSWWLGFATFTIAPPLLFGIVRTLIAAVDWLNAAEPLWWVLALLLAVSIVCALVYRRVRIPHRKPAPVLEESVPEPVAEPWGLPEGMRNGGL